MRLRSFRHVHLPLLTLVSACASAQAAETSTLPDVAALEQRAQTLGAENQRQAEQITLLRGQLALAQAEAREARLRDTPREVVRIGGDAAPSVEAGWIEHESPVEVSTPSEPEPPTPPRVREEEDAGPRPVLRLHGEGAMPLLGSSAVRESLPEGPAQPPTVASVVGPSVTPFPPPAAPTPVPAAPAVLGRGTPADANAAREMYRVALSHVTGRRFDQAIPSLTSFIERYPSHPYVDNAVFWRATAYYALRRYNDALADFQRVVAEFPSGNKVPDALLQIGLCYQRLGDDARARVYFERLRHEFPRSVAARLAAREDTT